MKPRRVLRASPFLKPIERMRAIQMMKPMCVVRASERMKPMSCLRTLLITTCLLGATLLPADLHPSVGRWYTLIKTTHANNIHHRMEIVRYFK